MISLACDARNALPPVAPFTSLQRRNTLSAKLGLEEGWGERKKNESDEGRMKGRRTGKGWEGGEGGKEEEGEGRTENGREGKIETEKKRERKEGREEGRRGEGETH